MRVARFADLSAAQLYALLRLRVDVFVVEQRCPYPELDGRDTDPATEHLWVETDGEPTAYLRVLDGGDAAVIGRVATVAAHRGQGHAAALMREALSRVGAREVRLHAQSYLEGWYAGFGFVRTGPDFLDDGIPHLPMRRAR